MKMEIKFRIWDGREMEYDITTGKFGTFYVNPENGDGLNPRDLASLTTCTTKYSDDIPLMQFTGLLDKNGKEIYSDDIISNGEYKNRVYTMYGGFAIKAPYWSPDMNDMGIGDDLIMQPLSDAQTMSFISESCEVIGNIYENPELIEKK